jgi:NADPH:quinone reductase-like Zn-dependent oxidoreductase
MPLTCGDVVVLPMLSSGRRVVGLEEDQHREGIRRSQGRLLFTRSSTRASIRSPVGNDAILDTGGNSRLSHPRRVLTSRGRLVIVGGENDGRWLGGFDSQLLAIVLSPLVSQKLGILGAKENAADLSVLRELLESGKVTPAVDRTYPLSEAAAAIRYFQEGNARGKVVIAV